MSVVIIGIFGAMMIGAAIFAVYSRSILSAIISSGVISLLASIIYILLAAPDVAMTEAAIGSGLTTVVFLLALRRIHIYAAGTDSNDRVAAGQNADQNAGLGAASNVGASTDEGSVHTGGRSTGTGFTRSAEEAIDD